MKVVYYLIIALVLGAILWFAWKTFFAKNTPKQLTEQDKQNIATYLNDRYIFPTGITMPPEGVTRK